MADVVGRAPNRAYTRCVDAPVLKRRQIRLYIETSALQYLAAVASAVALCGAVLYQFSPILLPQIVLWSAAIGFDLARTRSCLGLVSAAAAGDEAIEPWLKWFAVPQVCAVCLIASGPLLMLPDPAGHDVEVSFTLSMLAYCAALASSIKLSAYRPMILIALVPMVAIYVAGMLQLPGAVPKLLGVGGVLAGLWGYRLSGNVNEVDRALAAALDAQREPGARRRARRARQDALPRRREPRPAPADARDQPDGGHAAAARGRRGARGGRAPGALDRVDGRGVRDHPRPLQARRRGGEAGDRRGAAARGVRIDRGALRAAGGSQAARAGGVPHPGDRRHRPRGARAAAAQPRVRTRSSTRRAARC